MLYAYVLTLRPLGGEEAPRAQGHRAHGLFLRLIEESDPRLSERLHDEQGRKPFTVGEAQPQLGDRGRGEPSSNGVVRLRVTLLDDALFGPFIARFLRPGGPPLRLGSTTLAVEEVAGSSADSPLAGYSDFSRLIDVRSCGNSIGMAFESPTAFSFGQIENGRRRMETLPQAALVFDSLLRKWNTFAPADLHFDPDVRARLEEYCVVAQHQIRTATFRFPRHWQTGFVGRCRFEVLGDDPRLVHMLNVLSAFSLYAGVGYKTTMGMGQTRPLHAMHSVPSRRDG